MNKQLFISFSGGETSAFMAQWLLKNKWNLYDEIVTVFANTGQENEETLRFVDKCDKEFELGVIWVEAEVNPESKKGTGHRVVDFHSASRNGEPFEAVIAKYGIPSPSAPHCTRELKAKAINSYLKHIGWDVKKCDTAIGIRADEIDRVNPSSMGRKVIYPLITDIEMTKPRVNAWWQQQPFRLQLKGYEGNCKWCWKKSLRKHLTLLTEHPEWYDFPERMERQYSHAGPMKTGEPRVFFRGNKSTKDLRYMAENTEFTPASDDAQEYEDQLSLDLDSSNGCSESCEVEF